GVRPVRTAPAPFISAKRPGIVYLVDKEGRLYTVASPRVEGDSVIGLSPRMNTMVGVPLSSVGSVSAAQPDHARTALLVVLLGAGAGGLVYALGHAGSGEGCITQGAGNEKVPSVTC